MSWQFTITLWVLSVIVYVFFGAVLITMAKNAMVSGLKEVVLFYLSEKSKWIDKLEEKLGKGSAFGPGILRN